MYIVEWDDHTGQRHELEFARLEDALLEAQALEVREDVEYVGLTTKRK